MLHSQVYKSGIWFRYADGAMIATHTTLDESWSERSCVILFPQAVHGRGCEGAGVL